MGCLNFPISKRIFFTLTPDGVLTPTDVMPKEIKMEIIFFTEIEPIEITQNNYESYTQCTLQYIYKP